LDTRQADRYIELTRGNYYWRTCITPFDGRFIVHTLLRNPRGGEATQDATSYMNYAGTISAKWGSALETVG
jgi:hypothetical protein